jgi:gamma-glutamylcyclotransferase (GGCT)/AIG2-like uncharacterized protein YtfP
MEDPYKLEVRVPFLMFVYGILREGRIHELADDIEQLRSRIRTAEKYTMRCGGIAFISEGGKHSILGDVYRINSVSGIRLVHGMESGAGYVLKPIEVPGFEEPVYAYFDAHESRSMTNIVPSGDYINWRKEEERTWQKY